jgi:hypothetical protein
MKLKTILVLLAANAMIFYTTPNPMNLILDGQTNVDYVRGALKNCDKIVKKRGNNVVVLRLDDVQAFAWSEISMKIINDAFAHNAPVTIGVIPKNLPEDTELSKYLRENRCNLEFALHGWDHTEDPPEFSNLSEAEALNKIRMGKELVEKTFQSEMLTFIPPKNLYSAGTGRALASEGFMAISSEGEGEYDYDASTYDYKEKKLVDIDKIMDLCSLSIAQKGRCIIMIHPQDFASGMQLDSAKYDNFLELLNKLDQRGVVYSTIADEVFSNINFNNSTFSSFVISNY